MGAHCEGPMLRSSRASVLWDGSSRHDYRSDADANDCIVVTDNEKDFADVETINPLRMTV
jgi:hypothetical protein